MGLFFDSAFPDFGRMASFGGVITDVWRFCSGVCSVSCISISCCSSSSIAAIISVSEMFSGVSSKSSIAGTIPSSVNVSGNSSGGGKSSGIVVSSGGSTLGYGEGSTNCTWSIGKLGWKEPGGSSSIML